MEQGIASIDGMVVFGFGRAEGATPLMKDLNTFYVGFWPEAVPDEGAHERIGGHIERIVE